MPNMWILVVQMDLGGSWGRLTTCQPRKRDQEWPPSSGGRVKRSQIPKDI